MNLDDWHLVFISVCLVLIIAACVPVVVALLPKGEEPFMVLAVLGDEESAEHYYPSDDPQIKAEEEVNWTIYLYNNKMETRYVAVKVKLLNSTMESPNSTSNSPSIAPVVYEVRHFIYNNETWLHPFSWSLLDVEQGEFFIIRSLVVNSEIVDTHVVALQGYNYRFVFELWIYDEELRDFRFDWSYDDEVRCLWNQLWFNTTSSLTF